MPNPGWPQNIQGRVFNILNIGDEYDTDQEIDVGTTDTARSDIFFLPSKHTFAWAVQFSSGGAIDVKVELEQQFLVSDGFAVPDNKTNDPMFEITDSNLHLVAYSPIASLNGRLKLTGQGSNAADTKLILAKVYLAGN